MEKDYNFHYEIIDKEEVIRYLGADISPTSKPKFYELAVRVGHECEKIIEFEYLRLYKKIHLIDTTVTPKIVYPAQIYATGMPTAEKSPQLLYTYAPFSQICKVIWRTQLELIDLFVQSPRNYVRGDASKRCLGLREPIWSVAANGGAALYMLKNSDDFRVRALNATNNINFNLMLHQHMKRAIVGAEDFCQVSKLTNIINDEKKMKNQRITRRLREAAAEAWQSSTSGKYAGVTLTDQVLSVNNWRKSYRDMSDGAQYTAIKLNGEQHCLRSKAFLCKDGNDRCRVCSTEKETAGHLLGGSYTGTKNLVIARHNFVQRFICDEICKPACEPGKAWRVEQNPSLPRTFGHNKPDIIVEFTDGKKCFVLDRTLRWEFTDEQVTAAVQDKAAKYEPLKDYLKLTKGYDSVEVRGLYFGARGILLKATIDFLSTTFGIAMDRLLILSGLIMNYTCSIYNEVISGHLTEA